MMIANLGFLTRILIAFHIKSTDQRLYNGLNHHEFFILLKHLFSFFIFIVLHSSVS